MTTSGNSDDKLLLYSNTEPLIESSRMLFWKNTLKKKKKISDKEKKLINKAKYFTEDNNRDVWSDRNFFFDLPRINIG